MLKINTIKMKNIRVNIVRRGGEYWLFKSALVITNKHKRKRRDL